MSLLWPYVAPGMEQTTARERARRGSAVRNRARTKLSTLTLTLGSAAVIAGGLWAQRPPAPADDPRTADLAVEGLH